MAHVRSRLRAQRHRRHLPPLPAHRWFPEDRRPVPHPRLAGRRPLDVGRRLAASPPRRLVRAGEGPRAAPSRSRRRRRCPRPHRRHAPARKSDRRRPGGGVTRRGRHPPDPLSSGPPDPHRASTSAVDDRRSHWTPESPLSARCLQALLGSSTPSNTPRHARFLFIDLVRFKEVNDAFGHLAGDQLLKKLGPRLARSLASGDVLVRVGGDEFGIVLPNADDAPRRSSCREADRQPGGALRPRRGDGPDQGQHRYRRIPHRCGRHRTAHRVRRHGHVPVEAGWCAVRVLRRERRHRQPMETR